MKTRLTALLSLVAAFAFGHGGVEIGPNGGRILEFSKNETLHGEVTVKDGTFAIALLDKDMKPLTREHQEITVSTGDRDKPTRLTVEKTASGFTTTGINPGQWVIVQFRPTAEAKAITARFKYDTGLCDGCDEPEWLCKCKP